MNDYADWLEAELTGGHDHDRGRMDEDPQSFTGDDGDEPEVACTLCGCTEAAWSGLLGDTFHWCCRDCGMTQYLGGE
jgi:hypothetical protein